MVLTGCDGGESTTGTGGSSASTSGNAGGAGGANAGGGGAGGAGGGSTGGAGGGSSTVIDTWPPSEPADALKAAAFIGSCVPDDGVNPYLNRIYTWRGNGDILYELLPGSLECLKNKANGCAAVEECLGFLVDQTGPCATTCANGKLAGCDGSMKYQLDCSKHMLDCSADAFDCVSIPPPSSCDPATFVQSCEAGAPVACTHIGVESGPECSLYGLTCGVKPGGGVGCLGSGAACAPPIESSVAVWLEEGTCQGGKLNVCVNGGEALIDCGMLGVGFTCQTFNGVSFCGLASECSPGQAKTTCQGDNMVVCNAGRIDEISCSSLGFTGCSAFAGFCVPGPYGSP